MHSKAILFYDERLNILNQILCILNINDVNNTFFLHKLDNDIDKQNSILSLEKEIKKYFVCSSWTCFCKNNIKRKHLSIIKNLFKDMNYDIIPKRVVVKNNNIPCRDTIYYVVKKY